MKILNITVAGILTILSFIGFIYGLIILNPIMIIMWIPSSLLSGFSLYVTIKEYKDEKNNNM